MGDEMFPKVIYKVYFGMYFREHSEGDYSYLDYKNAWDTFTLYQQMGWDYIGFEVLQVSYDEQGFPYIPAAPQQGDEEEEDNDMSYPDLICLECFKDVMVTIEGIPVSPQDVVRDSSFVRELDEPSLGHQEDLLYLCEKCGYSQIAYVVIEDGVRKIVNTFFIDEETGSELQEIFGDVHTFDPL